MRPNLANDLLSLEEISRLISLGLPGQLATHSELLSGGLRNANYRVHLSAREPVVLRLYLQDPSACQKEVDLLRFIRKSVPVQEVLYACADERSIPGAFAILEYVDGLTFQQLKRTGDRAGIASAACSAGQTLAAIGRFAFTKPGRLGPGLEVGLPYLVGQDPIPRLCDTFIESPKLQQRTGTYLARQLHEYIWSWAPRLANLNEDRRLVHSDFGSRNILVKCVNDRWMVAAVLDWEFAFSGSPLLDVGHFLRYEKKQLPLREPWFSSGFVEGGGSLCDDWRELARAVDLTGLCASLAEPALPDDVTIEILGLIRATLEARDPD